MKIEKKTNTGNAFELSLDDDILVKLEQTKFLGVIIDSNLCWKAHIDWTKRCASKLIGILYKTKHLLGKDHLLSLYCTLVYPYLTYCNIIWGNACVSSLNSIYLLQKRLVRLISNSPYLAHTLPLFSSLKILNIYQLNKYLTLKFMYLYVKQKIPSHIISPVLCSQLHQYNTRRKSLYYIESRKTRRSQSSLGYHGVKL